MSASLLNDSTMLISTPEVIILNEPESVTCDCCGLTEECTQSYINTIKERYMGKWICGLCSEAVKYEVIRTKRLLTTEEAMTRHMKMCNMFKSSSPPSNPTGCLIIAMRQILRRSLDSPRMLRSVPNSPRDEGDCVSSVLSRSDSCLASLT